MMVDKILSKREIKNKYYREWRKKNRGRINKYLREYRKSNPELTKARQERWKRNHPDKYKEVNKNYYLRNREKILKKQKKENKEWQRPRARIGWRSRKNKIKENYPKKVCSFCGRVFQLFFDPKEEDYIGRVKCPYCGQKQKAL